MALLQDMSLVPPVQSVHVWLRIGESCPGRNHERRQFGTSEKPSASSVSRTFRTSCSDINLPGLTDGVAYQDTIFSRRSSVSGQHGVDAPNERMEFRHVLMKELGGRVIRHFSIPTDKARRELDVGFDRVHLR